MQDPHPDYNFNVVAAAEKPTLWTWTAYARCEPDKVHRTANVLFSSKMGAYLSATTTLALEKARAR